MRSARVPHDRLFKGACALDPRVHLLGDAPVCPVQMLYDQPLGELADAASLARCGCRRGLRRPRPRCRRAGRRRGRRNATGSSLYFAISSSTFTVAAAASPGVQPFASVLASSTAMRRLTSGSSLATALFIDLDAVERMQSPARAGPEGKISQSRTERATSSADTRLRKAWCRASGENEAASMWSPITRRARAP